MNHCRLGIAVIITLAVQWACLSTWAACLDQVDSPRYLKTIIGEKYFVNALAAPMNCDTVYVREDDTVRVYPGSHLYFSQGPKPYSTLIVKGCLIITGTVQEPVYLSGDIATNSLNRMVPTKDSWRGIQVTKTGTLIMSNTRVFGAKRFIESETDNVKLYKVYIEGSERIMGPHASELRLNPNGTTIDTLFLAQLRKPNSTTASPSPKSFEKLNQGGITDSTHAQARPQSNWKPWAIGGGAVLIVGTGTWIAWELWGGSEAKPPVLSDPFSVTPTVPATPPGR